MSKSKQQELISVSEAAKLKGVSRPTIYAWIEAGKISTGETAGGRVGVVVDGEFKKIVAQGLKTQDFVYTEINEMQDKIEALQTDLAELRALVTGTPSPPAMPPGCRHDVTAKPVFPANGDGSAMFHGVCSKCGLAGANCSEPDEAVNAFFQIHVYANFYANLPAEERPPAKLGEGNVITGEAPAKTKKKPPPVCHWCDEEIAGKPITGIDKGPGRYCSDECSRKHLDYMTSEAGEPSEAKK